MEWNDADRMQKSICKELYLEKVMNADLGGGGKVLTKTGDHPDSVRFRTKSAGGSPENSSYVLLLCP